MTNDADLGPELSSRLTYLLKRAFLELEDLHREQLDAFGINGRELAVLLLLDGREPESQQQAAGRLRVDRTTMVSLLDALEGKGLVVRQTDPQDRRRNVVAVTESGRTTLRQALKASDEAERRLLSALSESDGTQLRRLLAQIANRPASET